MNEGEVHKYTLRIGFGMELCDPKANVKHTGTTTVLRKGTRGKYPNIIDFTTDCGKYLKSVSHKCDHNLPDCPDCKKKLEITK